jgi:hypothetical protein
MDTVTSIRNAWFSPGTYEQARERAPLDVVALLVALDEAEAKNAKLTEDLRRVCNVISEVEVNVREALDVPMPMEAVDLLTFAHCLLTGDAMPEDVL